MKLRNYFIEVSNTARKRDISSKGSGEADRSFRQDPPKCECGRRHVSKKGKKCILCKREGK